METPIDSDIQKEEAYRGFLILYEGTRYWIKKDDMAITWMKSRDMAHEVIDVWIRMGLG